MSIYYDAAVNQLTLISIEELHLLSKRTQIEIDNRRFLKANNSNITRERIKEFFAPNPTGESGKAIHYLCTNEIAKTLFPDIAINNATQQEIKRELKRLGFTKEARRQPYQSQKLWKVVKLK